MELESLNIETFFTTIGIPVELVGLMVIFGMMSGAVYFFINLITPIFNFIYNFSTKFFYYELEICSSDINFIKFNNWMIKNKQHIYFQRKFKDSMVFTYDNGADEDGGSDAPRTSLSAGYQTVYINPTNLPFMSVTRTKDQDKKSIREQMEVLLFRLFTFRKENIQNFYDIVMNNEKNDGPKVYNATNGYWQECGVPKVVLAPLDEATNYLIADIDRFLKKKEEYLKRGIPYKRGYLLWGSPGTGKSSTIAYIAHKFNINVYLIVSKNIEYLMELVTTIKPNSIILIEDIDMTVAGHGRKNLTKPKPPKKSYTKSYNSDTTSYDITENDITENDTGGMEVLDSLMTGEVMREFLNSLDGLVDFKNAIVIATTNKPEVLDDALLRPGRIDKLIEFKPLTVKEQLAHINRFFDVNLNYDKYKQFPDMTIAELQLMCVTHMDDFNEFHTEFTINN